jgi:hypothetical protein
VTFVVVIGIPALVGLTLAVVLTKLGLADAALRMEAEWRDRMK